jgi:hypothetical protein
MVLNEKVKNELRCRELQHLLNGIRTSLQQGSNWLVSRIAPNGPICGVESVEYCHKATWGLYVTGVDQKILHKVLDWLGEKALRNNYDFYFEDEPQTHKDLQRVYRPLSFIKVGAWIGHPLAKNEQVINRILQYQHTSGGVFNYIGDNPDEIEEPEFIGALDTSFFGHFMIALNQKERAIKAGDWLVKFVEANTNPMKDEGVLYCNMSIDGTLITDVDPDDPNGAVNLVDRAQPTWQTGTVMAYLSVLYDTLREKWGYTDSDAEKYLKATYPVIEFEDRMPLYTYFWPSKCKVAWGGGELLRVLVKYDKGTAELTEKAYRATKNTVVYTFIDNQLLHGGWANEHYPLSKSAPEYYYDYKPIKGISNVPDKPTENANSKTIYLPGEELTGENLGELKSAEKGIEAYLNYYWNKLL